MDLIKVGKFLQSLRKEKGLTQEQLAEMVGVAQRTVSRWETGNNMPDIDILIELSDFYKIDLREILSGERKSENMNEDLKETVLQVADYSSINEKNLIRRIIIISFAGCIAWGISLITVLRFINNVTGGIIVLISSLIFLLLYALIMLSIKNNRTKTGYLNCLCGAFAATTISNIVMFIVFFRDGSYSNKGLIGFYAIILICVLAFFAAGVVVTIINGSKNRSLKR